MVKSQNQEKKRTYFNPISKKREVLKENESFCRNDCIEYIKNNPDKKLALFSVECHNGKRLHKALTYNQVFKESIKRKNTYNEVFLADDQIKLFIDIDIIKENIPKNINPNEYFQNILNESIKIVIDELVNYDIVNTPIIILNSHRKDKFSSHVIFKNVVFNNVYGMKKFMEKINNPRMKYLVDNGLFDLQPYKAVGFRMLWNSKLYKNAPLEYYRGINYNKENDIELFYDCLLRQFDDVYDYINIPTDNITSKTSEKTTTSKQQELIIEENDDIDRIIEIDVLEKYVTILSQERKEPFNKWIYVGILLKSCNNNSFDIWDSWSKTSEKYKGRNDLIYRWNSFKNISHAFKNLLRLCKRDSPIEFSRIHKPCFYLDGLGNAIKFESSYLLEQEGENIKDKTSPISNYIDEWMTTNDIKSILIRSTYNTGKTTFINSLINEYDPKKILFISYRITMTNFLSSKFKHLDVESYLDNKYSSDRLICQIESLYKLLKEWDIKPDGAIDIPSYDLIILDETESILNHFNSDTVDEKENTYDLFKAILHNSKKILCLDGDLSFRSIDIIKHFGNNKVLHNTVKKNKKHYTFIQDKTHYETQLDNELSENKNIVLVSLSKKHAEKIYRKYKDKYKCILHTSLSGDKKKELLKNVNDLWINFQLVIYSPVIEAGVDFSVVKHFDRIFVYFSPKSTSPRGTLQMIGRIRQVNNNNILVFTNKLPTNIHTTFFTYDDIKFYVSKVLMKYARPKFILDKFSNKYKIKRKNNSFTKLLIHNEVEKYNKRPSMFLSLFINMIEEKGHSYNIMKKTEQYKKEKKGEENKFLKEEIIGAQDVDDEAYQLLLNKEKNNCATRKDKICIQKHLYKKNFNVDTIDKKFLDNFYDKIENMKNLKSLMFGEDVPYYKSHNDKNMCIDYNKAIKQQQIIYLRDVIKLVGFSLVDKKIVQYDQIVKNIKIIKEKSLIYKDINFTAKIFEYPYKKINSVDNVRKFVGMFNTLSKSYSIYIKSNRKKVRLKINGSNKFMYENYYTLNYLDNIDQYISNIKKNSVPKYYIKDSNSLSSEFLVYNFSDEKYINQKDYIILESHDNMLKKCDYNDSDTDSDNEIYDPIAHCQLNYQFIDSDGEQEEEIMKPNVEIHNEEPKKMKKNVTHYMNGQIIEDNEDKFVPKFKLPRKYNKKL